MFHKEFTDWISAVEGEVEVAEGGTSWKTLIKPKLMKLVAIRRYLALLRGKRVAFAVCGSANRTESKAIYVIAGLNGRVTFAKSF